MTVLRLSVALVLALCVVSVAAIQCKDEMGAPVDWWFIHKLPLLNKGPVSPDGYGYYYADPTHPHYLSATNLHTYINGALGSTLSQYVNKTRPSWIAWNDQPPGTELSANGAHAKGVLAFEGSTGFLLRHSVPRFPIQSSKGEYEGFPEYARIYGQTFLCVSYTTANLDALASQLMLDAVTVYDAHLTKTAAQTWKNLSTLATPGYQPLRTRFTQTMAIPSLGGTVFTDFAKSKECNCELYTQVVAPSYASDMAVLSWGRPLMGPGCRPFTRYNVLDISGIVLSTPAGSVSYNETKEHSKLGLLEQGNVVCVGDINRMTSQAARGGGTTCFSNSLLWNALAKQIGEWKTCN